ncbi:MAG: translation initiation factor IF-6 [Candidatus Diapherotrites archaeon]|uniref:Translation initiation factor IF-6 n=1 Tax=Candidatus Iainarchaeum sp. TaxID=3101447 RepID=A0A7J4IXM7_9ARCH|nr:MAG: translation initiation factor 6 [archaeon GW2011_AR10]MBS3059518.1 translation initiation factor IF-6 [Candidatus Diapherotrites archaeon]HIH09005.1 translation initiation factor IF-6 [Candidatus Diapherotrites archaeon]
MHFLKKTIRGSPFVGVFAVASEDFFLVPFSIEKKELAGIEEKLGAKVVKASLASSPLLGVLSVMLGKMIALPETVIEEEVAFLERHGMQAKKLEGIHALGNLIAVNENGGIASPLIGKKTVEGLEKFFGVHFSRMTVAGSNLAGAATTVTNKGFIVHPNIKQDEFRELEKIFGVRGQPTSANYGDKFIGNDIVANSKGALIGEFTTSYEVLRINEGLSGD